MSSKYHAKFTRYGVSTGICFEDIETLVKGRSTGPDLSAGGHEDRCFLVDERKWLFPVHLKPWCIRKKSRLLGVLLLVDLFHRQSNFRCGLLLLKNKECPRINPGLEPKVGTSHALPLPH
jgi:hypothetical protein